MYGYSERPPPPPPHTHIDTHLFSVDLPDIVTKRMLGGHTRERGFEFRCKATSGVGVVLDKVNNGRKLCVCGGVCVSEGERKRRAA